MASFDNASSLPIQPILAEQISLLDFVFPGFTRVLTTVLPLLASNLNIYARVLCACGMFIFIGNYFAQYFWRWLDTYFTSTVHVGCTDEAYDMLISWVSSQPFAQSARSSLATIDLQSSGRWNKPKSHADDIDGTNKKPLHYAPWNGRFYFWHKHHLFVFQRMQTQGQFGFPREEVSISCFSRCPSVLREFLDECRSHYLGLVQDKTSVFEHEANTWKLSKPRSKRQISTVVLNKKVKEVLVNDISDFLKPATRRWYSKRAIPYQRGYLLYGPPGTGKSSFSFSIAGQFDLDIYILNISGLNDNKIKALFAELPRRCVLLLEDVDAVSSKRSDANMNLGQNGAHPSPPRPAEATVSLSTLLNILDGVGSSEGRVLIMTTNHIERLDGALIRPGRADMKIEFQLADEDMVARLFCFVYDPELGKCVEGTNLKSVDDSSPEKSFEGDDTDKEEVVEDDEILEQAKEFAAKVPRLEFSPAEIMSLLLANKQSPRQAINNVDVWMETIREERKKLKRADSWVLDEGA
ncbi:BCS1 N terminal-domain-containing protein [Phaeosphaeriaceae sp. PMI808]|nr:BCS1 N terminal-domain-containing protein [Phaeosphaeriaceae sp. PMI808]